MRSVPSRRLCLLVDNSRFTLQNRNDDDDDDDHDEDDDHDHD